MGTPSPSCPVRRVAFLVFLTLILIISLCIGGITAARRRPAPPAPEPAPAATPAPQPTPRAKAAPVRAALAAPEPIPPAPQQFASHGQTPAVQPPPRPFGADPLPPFSLAPLPAPPAAPAQFPPTSPPNNWTSLTNLPGDAGFAASTPILLTDGRVLVEDVQPAGSNTGWWVLTPDNTGSYVNGSWSSVASPKQCYDTTTGATESWIPLYMASAVLPDGRVVAIGGEYNLALSPSATIDSPLGEIYDPVANTWTCLSNPSQGSAFGPWINVGDAMSIVLPNGTFQLGDAFGNAVATLNASTNPPTWTVINPTGKSGDNSGYNNEEGWTLLPNGKVLTAEVWTWANNAANTSTPADQYNPSTLNWDSAGTSPVPLALISLGTTNYREIGPAVLRPNGTVFASGATGNTAIYTPGSPGSWVAGPTFPPASVSGSCGAGGYTIPELLAPADAPAALLPDGNVLIEAGPVDTKCSWINGTEFFEFDGTNLNQVAGTLFSSQTPSFVGRLLTLPNGQILFVDGTGDAEVYTEAGSPLAGSAPTITSSPATVGQGATNMLLKGTQLNGLSGAVAYGDDYQAATNYPLVRITDSLGHVFYARTHGFSTMGVATGATVESTYFDVPAGVATGLGNLVVVANGIASSSNPVTILPASTTTLMSSVNPSTYSTTSTTFTATVTPSGAGRTGTVTFYDGTNSTATVLQANVALNGSSQAVFAPTTTTLAIGTHNITATYNGDATLGPSTSTAVLQVVNGKATTTGLVSATNPSLINNSVMFTATVTPTGGGTPTGSVTYLDANSTLDGNTVLGTVTLSGGVAPSVTIPLQFAGTHSITAVYSGDATFSGSTSTAVMQVVDNPFPTTTKLALTPPAVTVGSAGFNLVVQGTNFVPSSVIKFNGTALSTTYQASSQIYAALPSSDLITTGIFPVTVTNPAPGGGTSTPALTLTVTNPAPTLTMIAPASGTLNTAIPSLVLTGTGFVSSSTVNFGPNQINGGAVGGGGTTLTVSVPQADVGPTGPINVTVTNPQVNGLGGGTSGSQTFTVGSVASNTFTGGAGGTGTAWEVGTNWSLGHEPASTETAVIAGAFSPVFSGVSGTQTITALSMTSTGTLTISGGSLTISGASNTSSIATNIALGGGALVENGNLSLQATLNVTGGSGGGTLSGTGSINGSVTNSANVSPGTSAATGVLSINGNYTQTSTGSLNIRLGGTAIGNFDILNLTGSRQATTLAGTLNVTAFNSFAPAASNSFPILTFTSKSGVFSTSTQTVGGVIFTDTYATTSLTLTGPSAVAGTLSLSSGGVGCTAPCQVNFGTQVVDTPSGVITTTISNSGTGTITILNPQTSGDEGAGEFQLASPSIANDCPFGDNNSFVPFDLAPGAFCNVRLYFMPLLIAKRDFHVAIYATNSTNSPQGVDFIGTGIPNTPATIQPLGGFGQSAALSTQYAAPLGARVSDVNGFPVPGATVTFSAPGAGASVTFAAGNTATTDASGIAVSPAFSANGTAGTFNVMAATGAVGGAAFALNNVSATNKIFTLIGGGTGGNPPPAMNLCITGNSLLGGIFNGYYYVKGCNQIYKVPIAGGGWTLVAGNGVFGYSGDGGPATSAQIGNIGGMFVDGSGNVYYSDTGNNVVRVINGQGTDLIFDGITVHSGNIQAIAGFGSPGYNGDQLPAPLAQLSSPAGLYVDGAGDIFIADSGNNRIREISGGQITTVAGNGAAGFFGDGGQATGASLNDPQGVYVDSNGNIYIADMVNGRVREVVASTGNIKTIAGTGIGGYNGDGELATAATLTGPAGVYVDSSFNVFIADSNNERIREIVAATGDIQTVAGSGLGSGSPGYFGDTGDGALATSAHIATPNSVIGDGAAGDIFISTLSGIREIVKTTGFIQTVVENGAYGYSGDGGPAASAQLFDPFGIATDSAGNFYVADGGNAVIREKVAATGKMQTVAGTGTPGYSGDSGPATSAQIQPYGGVAVDSSGNVFFVDHSMGVALNCRIREIVMATQIIRTVAGSGSCVVSGDNGSALSAGLGVPSGIAVDANGNLYISIGNANGGSGGSRIRVVNRQGGTITVLGTTIATLNIATVAGNGTAGSTGDGGPATSAELNNPVGVALDSSGDLFIADSGNFRIRRIDHITGNITTVAGTGTAGLSGDGGMATSAQLSNPADVGVDASGDIFIADAGNSRVREVIAATGIIQTIAGSGIRNFTGDGGPALSAELDTAQRIALDPAGNAYFTDGFNARVRVVAAALNATPTINMPAASGLSPSTATVGSAGFSLQVNGTGFISGATVFFNGNARATTFNSATQLTATILAGDIAATGSFPVTVSNPEPTAGASNSVNFTVNPVGFPTINFTNNNGTGDGKWETATNWDLSRVPNSADTVGINAGRTATISATTGAVTVTSLSYASGGSLVISGSSLTFTATSTANVLTVSGGTLTANSTLTVSGATTLSPGGTINGTGMIGFNGSLTWSGGSIGGTVTVNANAGESLGGGATIPVLTGATFNNTSGSTATLTGTAAFNINSGGTFNNQAGGIFLGSDDAGISTTAGAGTFANAGTFTRGATAGTFAFTTTAFNNTGTVNVNTGTLSLNAGTSSGGGFGVGSGATLSLNGYATTSGSSIAGAGTILFTGGTSTIAGPYTPTGTTTIGASNTDAAAGLTLNYGAGTTGNLNFTDGALGGTGTLTVNGTMTWTGGLLEIPSPIGNPTLTIAAGAFLNLPSPDNPNSPPQMNGGNLSINGTANLSTTLDFESGYVVDNNVVNLNADVFITSVSGINSGSRFYLYGTLNKTAGTGAGGGGIGSTVAILDNGSGTINANVGNLHFDSGLSSPGTTTVNAGASIVSNVIVTGGTVTDNGTITGTVYVNSSGTLKGTGTIAGAVTNTGTLHPGSSPGTLTILNNFTQTSTGSLNLDINGTTAGSGYSVLAISGTATLAGTINASTSNSFTPAVGNAFQVMTFASESGNFTTSDLVVNGVGLTPSFNPGGSPTSLTLTAVPGAPATVTVETKADGTGTLVPAQSVPSGTSATGFAISRDGSGNFIANVAATWSLVNVTGGVVSGDLVPSGDTKSATFTGHLLGSAAMHTVVSGLASTNSGTLTVVAGTATTVRVETKADGTGATVPAQNVTAGSSVTGFAISRDALGNFVGNVAATWSLANVTGGVVSGDLVPSGDTKSATFTGHLLGSATMHAVVSGSASTDSGTLTVVASTATAVRVETKADGTGTLVSAQNVSVGNSVTGFSISRDTLGNFAGNVAATWSLANITGGVVSGDLVPSGDNKSATFTGHLLGSATMHAVVSGLASTDSGTLTVIAGVATAVKVETKPDGSGTVVPIQNVPSGTSVTGYAISRDAGGNFLGNVAATWTLVNATGGVVSGDLVPAGDNKSATFTGHVLGTAAMHAVVSGLASTDSGTLTVVAGTATAVRVETKADGTGTLVPAQGVTAGSSVTGFAISRDASGNFIANVAATWSLANVTGSVVSGDLAPSGDTKSATFTGHLLGAATMHAVVSGLTSTDSGTLTVVAGSAAAVRVETKADGSGTLVPAQNVGNGTSVTGFAISRDAGGNFIANVAATWSLANVTGGVVSGDLLASGDTKSATFTGHLLGTATMHAVVSGLSSTDSGTLTVVAGLATTVRVETKADGTGTALPAQSVISGSSVTGFAISRDVSGNFAGNVAATWSLANITGSVVSGDLVPAGDSKSATFTGHLIGTAAMHAVVSGLASTDSGTLTVLVGAAATVKVETKADGTGTIVPAQNVVSGTSVTGFAISRDAAGNFLGNVAATWSLANVAGGVVSGDLVPSGDTKSATFTGHLLGSATMHAVVSGSASTDSGTLTVVASTATAVRVETKADGTGTLVSAQNVSVGNSVTGFSISRDTLGNFAGNVAATWSLANITGGVVSGDLVPSGDNKSATFTGHLLGSATMHAVVSGLASTDSGTLTVIAGVATAVKVETKPDGSGTVVPIQNVPSGTSVTGYAISRDAGGNFLGNVAATWTLVNATGGVVSGDLVPAGDNKSATFTGHVLGTAAMHAVVSGLASTDSGTLTVVAGTATAVRVETKADGSGTLVSAQSLAEGNPLTVFSISRDAGGNFVANVAATWSLVSPTGGVVSGDLVPAGDGKSATLTGHLTGTAAIQATVTGLSSINSGTLTIIAGGATTVQVETKPDGTGTLVPAQSVASGTSVTGYAISRDGVGNFVANVAATWSLANVTGSVVSGDLVAAGDSKSATFTGHLLGTSTMHAVVSGLSSADSGTLTVTVGTATSVKVETKLDGTGTIVPAQNVVSGTSVIGYAISRDGSGNFVANVAATWSLANLTGGIAGGDLVPAGDFKSATFTGHVAGTATMHAVVGGLTSTDSGTQTVTAGTATAVRVETKADGTGTVVSAQNVAVGNSVTGFAISRDASGNFVANAAATWSLANITGSVVSGDLVPAGDSKSATFSAHGLGTATIHAVVSGLSSTDSGTLTVIVGVATSVKVETKPDGSGTVVPAQNVPSGTSVTGYAISRDAGGNFLGNVAATWTLVNATGGVVSGDLVAAGDSKSATFSGHVLGTAAMHAVVSGLASTDSGTLTVIAGTATTVKVETKADGTGTVVPAQNLPAGTSATGFAISRDASGNFVANAAATWSLANITGGVVSGDLVPAGDNKSATFTGHLLGTATLHAVVSGLTSTDSGTLTVTAAAVTAVRVETKPDGTGTVVPAQNVASGTTVTGYAISRDTPGNFVANVAATWSLASPTGGVVSGDLVPSGDTKSATFTGHVIGTASMHAVVSGLTSTDSGKLTVVVGTVTAVKVETKADGTGTVVPAQNVASTTSATGFAISRDAAGNFIANVAATWSLTGATGGVVGGDLVPAGDTKSATFTGHLLGTAAMHAVVSGLTSTDSGTLTVTAGAPSTITATAGTPQTSTVSTAYATALKATVKDALGNVAAGLVVTFTAPANGASGTFAGSVNTATTDATGVATAPAFTANATGGAFAVTANVTPALGTPATFNLTNVSFTLALANPGTVQVTGGTPANVQFNLTTTPAGAQLPATVNYTCMVPAELSGTTCAMNPTSTAAGATSGQTTLMITTAAGVPSAPRQKVPPATYLLWLTTAALASLMGIYFAGRRKLLPWRVRPAFLALGLLVIAAGATVGCTTAGLFTPKGPATINVTATSGGAVVTTQVNINVN